jgi:hypothetical protein
LWIGSFFHYVAVSKICCVCVAVGIHQLFAYKQAVRHLNCLHTIAAIIILLIIDTRGARGEDRSDHAVCKLAATSVH